MLPLQERIFLYKYLARTLNRGIKVQAALAYYLEDVILKKRYKREVSAALTVLTKRRDLSQALYTARLLPEQEFLILKFAEQQQIPDNKILLTLAENLNQFNVLKRKIKTLFIYPTVLIFELLVIFTLIIFWLAPQMQIFFNKLNINTPIILQCFIFLNRIFVNLGDYIHWSWWLVIITLVWLGHLLLKIPMFKISFDYLAIRLYKIGQLYRLILMQRVFVFLAIVIGEQRKKDIYKELKTVSAVTSNLAYRQILLRLTTHLEKGGQLKQFWQTKKNRLLFPILVRRLLILGEQNGDYAPEIKVLVQILTEELELELKQFISILEPLLILTLASIVAILALTLQNMINQMQRVVNIGS